MTKPIAIDDQAFLNDRLSDFRAACLMVNLSFNISEWWDGSQEGNPRWVYGTSPNLARGQHMLYDLSDPLSDSLCAVVAFSLLRGLGCSLGAYPA